MELFFYRFLASLSLLGLAFYGACCLITDVRTDIAHDPDARPPLTCPPPPTGRNAPGFPSSLAPSDSAAQKPALPQLPANLKLSPAILQTYSRANAAFQARDFERAFVVIQDAMKIDQWRTAWLWIAFGDIHLARGNAGDALDAYRKAKSLATDPGARSAVLQRIEAAMRTRTQLSSAREARSRDAGRG